jgi:hypothetical protein
VALRTILMPPQIEAIQHVDWLVGSAEWMAGNPEHWNPGQSPGEIAGAVRPRDAPPPK